MSYAFIGGIPASGKSTLAKSICEKIGSLHVEVDDLRERAKEDPSLEKWVDFFWDLNEKDYLSSISPADHWENLKKQSENIWPYILREIKNVQASEQSAIFEGVSILPHLAKKDLSFSGIFLLGESFEEILKRNILEPRWAAGEDEELLRKEAVMFYDWERPIYKTEAEKYGFKVFNSSQEAESALLELMK